MKHVFLLILALFSICASQAQCILIIHQVGKITDTLFVGNYEEEKQPKRINDSTLEFICNPSPPECIALVLDRKTHWWTRIWMDPKIKQKEITINYSTKTTAIKDPGEWDVLTLQLIALSTAWKDREHDSIAAIYVNKNPDSYLSLWLLSHGMYRDNSAKKLQTLNKLSPALKEYPEYKQTMASLNDRKYPNIGDPFKEFSRTQKNDLIFNSNSIKNKWILLNFWSNGCGPCVREMDAFVNFYMSIDTSKAEFISISLDEKKELWKKSPNTNKIIWPSVWEEGSVYGDLCLNYNLPAMPYFVLFDKDKKIYFMKDGANELESIKETFKEKKLLK